VDVAFNNSYFFVFVKFFIRPHSAAERIPSTIPSYG